jgi:Uma2 family endonuclease
LGQADEADGYLPLAPDLVVEVVSPHERFTHVEQKALDWLEAGSSLVVVVDPGTCTVRAYRARTNITVLHGGDILEAEGVVPGWQLSVGELFT